MDSLKLRIAKIRHFPLCIKKSKKQLNPNNPRESMYKGIFKALQTVSEALYIQMIL